MIVDSNAVLGPGASGGGIAILDAASLVMIDGRVADNSTDVGWGGGGIRVTGGILTLDSVRVQGNRAGGGGGGLSIDGASGALAANIRRSEISNNSASFGGGALVGNAAEVTFLQVDVLSNQALLGGGGALYIQGTGSARLTDVRASGNRVQSAGMNGGGVFVDRGELQMTRGSVDANRIVDGLGAGSTSPPATSP